MAKKGRDVSKQNGGHRSSGLVISLLGVIFLGFMATQWHDRQRVTKVNVVGATGLSRIAVERSVDTLKSKYLKAFTLADVRACVESTPYVRNASVYFTGIREVTVEVEERLPVAHVVRADGSLRYVDAFGVVLPNAVERTAHNVPVLQSTDCVELSAQDVQHIVEVLVAGSRTLHPMLYQAISEVRLDRRSQAVTIVTDDTTWRLGVMNAARASLAFADMNVFWRETSQRLDMTNVSQVDLRWHNQVVLRYHAVAPLAERAA